jgi:vacuolar-type H+-ATPase subunit I/STV1
MPDSTEDIANNVQKKISEFAQILQNFGLNLIQSIGQMKHSMEILSEKIDKIANELIELKGLKTQMLEFGKFRKEMGEEISKISASVKNFNVKLDQGPTEKTGLSNFKSLNTAHEVLNELERCIRGVQKTNELREMVKNAREQLFVITGGHKILLELREFDRHLKPNVDLQNDALLEDLTIKIGLWKSQF